MQKVCVCTMDFLSAGKIINIHYTDTDTVSIRLLSDLSNLSDLVVFTGTRMHSFIIHTQKMFTKTSVTRE